MSWIIKRLQSFKAAFAGFAAMLNSEQNARIHLLATALIILLGIILQFAMFDWLFIASAIALVWITEGLNTALEALADEITKMSSAQIKRAKDIAAFAVLAAAVYSIIVAAFIISSKLFMQN